jgi:hypothetical protein
MSTPDELRVALQAEGLDFDNVSSWVDRPRRTRKRAAPSYWEEFVETDKWYQRKLIEDVPPEELYAALEDSDLSGDEGEEAEESESGEEDSEDTDFLAAVVDDIIPSDEEADAESDSDTGGGSDCEEEEGI